MGTTCAPDRLARLDDAILLRVLAERCTGHLPGAIGARVGWSARRVARDTDAVVAADLAESGEPAAQVLWAYAWRDHLSPKD